MGYNGTEHNSLWFMEVPSGKLQRGVNSSVGVPTPDVYEIRPRKDGHGFDLISDGFRRGPIWYSGPDAVRNAVAYAKFRSHSRSHRAIIRVLAQSGAVIQTARIQGISETAGTQ
jgi:hypothetical protein